MVNMAYDHYIHARNYYYWEYCLILRFGKRNYFLTQVNDYRRKLRPKWAQVKVKCFFGSKCNYITNRLISIVYM
jgi:hypothetical protein